MTVYQQISNSYQKLSERPVETPVDMEDVATTTQEHLQHEEGGEEEEEDFDQQEPPVATVRK